MSYQTDWPLASDPSAVFEALTTSQGIGAWWAKSNRLWRTNDGAFLSVDFGPVQKLLQIDEAREPTRVVWRVLECTLHEWPGTRIVFEIEPSADGGCTLHLEHEGLNPGLECFDSCSAGWAYFMGSLKRYVETGAGSPG